ncbi:hypothetical protein K7432_012742 [Basidiobolus ranarum]|uniref:Uncharacterized protein n=1 Tax=Basidiobolus ranarum TaxID=34480 RepID=A0ABR2VSD9_9FUNG
MNVDRINNILEDLKPHVELPPAYSTIIGEHKSSLEKVEPISLNVVMPKKHNPDTSVIENPIIEKMVHLESLCSTMHTMLESQSLAYKDVKTHLSEISKSIIHLDGQEPTPKISQKLNELLPQETSILQPDSAELCEPTVEEPCDDDTGYNRVCNMLDGLLNDAQTAIATPPPLEINYSEDTDEELASSAALLIPIRQKLKEEIRAEVTNELSEAAKFQPPMPEVSSVKRDTTEIRFWCQVVMDGQEQEPYQIPRKLVLPNLLPHRGDSTGSIDSSDSLTSNCTESEGVVGVYGHSRAVVSMIYWTLLFALGVLLLDRYLIDLASGQVGNIMEHICPERRTELSSNELENRDDGKIEYLSEASELSEPVSCRRRRIRRNSM